MVPAALQGAPAAFSSIKRQASYLLQLRKPASLLLLSPFHVSDLIHNASAVSTSLCPAVAGCALLSFDPYDSPPIQRMPLSLPSAADLDSPLDGSALQPTTDHTFRGPSYLMVVGPGLWSIQYRQAALHMLLQS